VSAIEHRRRLLKKWSRTFHIYLSMLGLLGILFFAVTGFMLNHEDWFGLAKPQVRKVQGVLPVALLNEPDKLGIVEMLRRKFGVVGALDSFETEENEIILVFKGPARRIQATIQRAGGRVDVMFEIRSAAARLAELHRGVEAGSSWRILMDAIAILQIIGASTGVLLWWLVPRWRPLGMAALVVCLMASGLIYWALVP
jgi:uncharacterized protein